MAHNEIKSLPEDTVQPILDTLRLLDVSSESSSSSQTFVSLSNFMTSTTVSFLLHILVFASSKFSSIFVYISFFYHHAASVLYYYYHYYYYPSLSGRLPFYVSISQLHECTEISSVYSSSIFINSSYFQSFNLLNLPSIFSRRTFIRCSTTQNFVSDFISINHQFIMDCDNI